MPRLPPAYRISSNGSRGYDGIILLKAVDFHYRKYGIHEWTSVAHRPRLDARAAFRLRMLPLDDTRTIKYNTLAYARILQKYNTYATYPRAFMAARPLADVLRRGPVSKLLWADLLFIYGTTLLNPTLLTRHVLLCIDLYPREAID